LIATNYTYDDLLPETKYYWKVRANNSSQSTDSDIWSFTTRPENLMNWVSVNGGVYNVGNPDGNRFYHEETIGDFQLMNKEVTNLEYKIYLAEAYAAGLINVTAASITSDGVVYYNINGTNKISILIVGDKKYFLIEEGFEYHPVTHVSWYGAVAYADYYDYRLPTEWEWEVAARGGTVEDYPWGNSEPTDAMVANYRSSGDEFDNGTTPVGYFPAYHNLYDMAGNVWEWTSSDGDLVGNAQYKILRGGGWNSILPYLKCWVRNFDGTDKNYNPTYTGNTVGFRCAR
jgi:formylglycine-generating enzyme required for sulfatase activity